MKDRLKVLRKALGLKQREVAERLEVNVGVVGDWESGRAIPKARIIQICNEFNVRREWLERGEGEMFKDKPERAKLKDFSDEDVYTEAMSRLFEALPDAAKKAFERFCDSLNEPKSKPDKPKGFDYEAQLKRFDFGDESIWKDYPGHRQ